MNENGHNVARLNAPSYRHFCFLQARESGDPLGASYGVEPTHTALFYCSGQVPSPRRKSTNCPRWYAL